MRFLLSSVLTIFSLFPAMGQSAVASLNITLCEIQSVRIAEKALIGDVFENTDRVEGKGIRFLLPLGSEVIKSVLSPPAGQNYIAKTRKELNLNVNNGTGDIAGDHDPLQQSDNQSDQTNLQEDIPLLLYQIYPR
jgi:hypothetical protein